MTNNCAIFYAVNSEDSVKESEKSMASFKRYMPDIPCALVAPAHIVNNNFDIRIIPRTNTSNRRWWIDRTQYIIDALNDLLFNGFHKILMLDSDTYACASVYELFTMLDSFDILGAFAPARITGKTILDIPDSFSEINLGVLAMRNSHIVREMWCKVYEWYHAHRDFYKNDQPVFREILWKYSWNYFTGPRFCILPSEYNLRFNFACCAGKKVKILHARSDNINKIVDTVNSSIIMRSWKKGELC